MRIVATVLLGLLLAPAVAGAGAEVTLSAGFRRGGTAFPIEARTPEPLFCFTTPCILAEATTEDEELLYTVTVGVPITKRWMAELLLTEQDGDLALRSTRVSLMEPEAFDSLTAQLGVVRSWGDGRIRPYVGGAVGGTQIESTALVYDRPLVTGASAFGVEEDVFSSSLATGLKAPLGRHLGLRLEGRAYWHALPERLGGTLRQNEGSLGLTYRW